MRQLVRCILLLVAVFALALPALAVEPDEVLDDPLLETRARALSAELRCLVCQNQSIDDSSAPLARDLRLLVRERLVMGDTDQQIVEFLVERYGEYVLLRPAFGPHTLALWGLTPAVMVLLIVMLVLRLRRRKSQKDPDADIVTSMTKSEKAILSTLGNKDK